MKLGLIRSRSARTFTRYRKYPGAQNPTTMRVPDLLHIFFQFIFV
jgi:hypothetical protein